MSKAQRSLIVMISAYAPIFGIALTVINIYYPDLAGPVAGIGSATLIILGSLLGIETFMRGNNAKPTKKD
jgi:hypothetical protein